MFRIVDFISPIFQLTLNLKVPRKIVATDSLNPAGAWRLYNVALMSTQRHDVASRLMRRCIHSTCQLGYLSIIPHLDGIDSTGWLLTLYLFTEE